MAKDATTSNRTKTGFGRWQGFTVFTAVALPIVAAWGIFYSGIGIPTETVNQGELLLPAHSVKDIALWGENGKKLNFSTQELRWRYLILAGDQCDTACEKLLYTSRQVHLRLGDKAGRVERMLVASQPLSDLHRKALQQQHPRLRIFTADSTQLNQWLSDSSHAHIARPSALLVDQQGFAMMVYNNLHSGNQLLKDIKRLLKYSYQK